jgi:hypothetical protein
MKEAVYSYDGDPILYCNKCKLEDMIDWKKNIRCCGCIVSKKKLEYKLRTTIIEEDEKIILEEELKHFKIYAAKYAHITLDKARFCQLHKTDEMVLKRRKR